MASPEPIARSGKKKLLFFLAVLVVLCFGFDGGVKEVVFKDNLLERRIRAELKAPLTPENLAGMTEFYGYGIKYLDGIEYCVNLRSLTLRGGSISDLSPLRGLKKLEEINLYNNLIRSVEPLQDLPALESLDLTLNLIHDLRPLSRLPRLRYLHLSGNRIFNLNPLGQMPQLEKLSLGANPFSDISPLSNLKNLLILDLREERTYARSEENNKWPVINYLFGVQFAIMEEALNRANSVNVLYSFAGRVTRTQGIIALKPLAGCVKLTNLHLDGNRIHDLGPLAAMKQMGQLTVPENFITDLSPIMRMENLSDLNLEQNLIRDLQPLLSMGRMGKLKKTELHLSGNPLSRKARSEQLPELKQLALKVTFK